MTITNFPEDYSREELLSLFDDMQVLNCTILDRRILAKSASWPQVKTRALITFANHAQAKEAIQTLNGVNIRGSKVIVSPDKSTLAS